MAIALLTDFGLTDIYTGVMKGVMHGINPNIPFIDITHGIDPQNVRQAAFALLSAYRYFPQGTVFLVVVDPGVGSTRRPIAVQAGGYTFVAPDNGVLSYTLAELGEVRAVEISTSEGEQAEISNTFHGRDIFAPAAAKLSAGTALESLGTPVETLFRLPIPSLIVDEDTITGEIIHIDRFGNLVTSIGHLRWVNTERLMLTPSFGQSKSQTPVSAENALITVHDQQIFGVRHTYSEAERGSLLALVGSTSYLEISVNQGNAATRLDAAIGDRIELKVGDVDAAVRD